MKPPKIEQNQKVGKPAGKLEKFNKDQNLPFNCYSMLTKYKYKYKYSTTGNCCMFIIGIPYKVILSFTRFTVVLILTIKLIN